MLYNLINILFIYLYNYYTRSSDCIYIYNIYTYRHFMLTPVYMRYELSAFKIYICWYLGLNIRNADLTYPASK